MDFLRLMRALRLFRDHPSYSIEAIAHDAGFGTVRTLNRKIQDALGITPGEFRVMSISKWLDEGFRKVETPNVQEIIADKEHLEKALAKSLKGGYTTVRLFAYHAKLSQYSARKQLNEWTKGENPKLLKTCMAQQDVYTEI